MDEVDEVRVELANEGINQMLARMELVTVQLHLSPATLELFHDVARRAEMSIEETI